MVTALPFLDPAFYPVGVATASLGMCAAHTLERKFSALQANGWKYTEIGFGDYVAWVRSRRPGLPASTAPEEYAPEAGEPDPADTELWDALYTEAPVLVELAERYGLKVLGLQPLNQFDGWREGPRADWVRAKAEKWLPLCEALGVQFIQVGSNDYAEADAPDHKTAADLRWLAELGAKHNVKIAYEVWCFSKRVNEWEHAWKLVQMADHPNLGLCYDTAHPPLAPRYGWNPTTGEGWTDAQFNAMLDRLRQVPGEKVFYVELSDVLTPSVPLHSGSAFDQWHSAKGHPRGDGFVWAVCGRPVPFVGRDAGRCVKTEADMGGARVKEQLEVLLDIGFKGPIMYEVFEAQSMEREAEDVSAVYAEACALGHERLLDALAA